MVNWSLNMNYDFFKMNYIYSKYPYGDVDYFSVSETKLCS